MRESTLQLQNLNGDTRLFASVEIGKAQKKNTREVTSFMSSNGLVTFDDSLVFMVHPQDEQASFPPSSKRPAVQLCGNQLAPWQAIISLYECTNGSPTFHSEGVLSLANVSGWGAEERHSFVQMKPYATPPAGLGWCAVLSEACAGTATLTLGCSSLAGRRSSVK